MKKEDIVSARPLGLTEGMVKCDAAKLRTTGQTAGIKFHKDDKIVFPDFDQLEFYTTTFTTKDGVQHDYELVKVAFNDRVRLIAVACFRRDKNGVDEICDEYSRESNLVRDLQVSNDDYERISILAGHTVVVKRLFEKGRIYKYEGGARIPYNKDDNSTFETRVWPVFDFED